MSTRINHKLLRMPYNADFPLQFWIHPALPYRRQLAVVIEHHGGQVEPIRTNADVALVCTNANSTLSASLYVKLILADDIVVDPSWIIDCIAYNFLIDEGDYMPVNLDRSRKIPDESSTSKEASPSDDYSEDTDEEDREAGEFLLDVMLRLDSLDWPEIYSYCCNTHPKHHSAEYWRKLNISGYQLHSISAALRRDIREAQRTPAPSYEDSIRVLQKAYAPCAPKSVIPSMKSSSHDFRPKGVFSQIENDRIRDFIMQHRNDADFEPNRQHWWGKAIKEFPQRDPVSLLKKFISSKELKALAQFQTSQIQGSNDGGGAVPADEKHVDDNADDAGPQEVVGIAANVKSKRVPKPWTAEAIAALKTIVIRERTKGDFHPRGIEWCGRWSDELGGRGKWAIYKAFQNIPEVAAEIPPQHHRQRKSLPDPSTRDPSLKDDESNMDISEVEVSTSTQAAMRLARLTYSQVELDRMRRVVERESSSVTFHPTSEDWWQQFEKEFPGRRAAGLAMRWRRLTANDVTSQYIRDSTPPNLRKRTHDEQSSSEADASDLSSVEDINDENDNESTQMDPEVSESELIAGMVRTVSTAARAAWNSQEIVILIDALYADGVSPQTFNKLAEQHGKRPGNWRAKWLKNRRTLQHILRMRRANDTALDPNALIEIPDPKTIKLPQSPPKKRARISSGSQLGSVRLMAPSPSITPPYLMDLEDEGLMLKETIKWFIVGIAKARPVGEAEVIDVWKQISNEHGHRLTKLLTLYCNNINIFEGLLNTIIASS